MDTFLFQFFALKLVFFLFSMIDTVAKLLKCLNSSAPQVHHRQSAVISLHQSSLTLVKVHMEPIFCSICIPHCFSCKNEFKMTINVIRSAGMSLCCLHVPLHAPFRNNPDQPDTFSCRVFC